jgi:trehalose synthase
LLRDGQRLCGRAQSAGDHLTLDQVHVPPLSLPAYAALAGEEAIAEIRRLAEPLRGARVLHVNATSFGGGVAELLPTLTGLMRDAGLDAEWRVVPGNEAFFNVTKSIHNGLQGMDLTLDESARRIFNETSAGFAADFSGDYDFVVIHDPQPAAIRSLRPDASGQWVWRCHIDLSATNRGVWEFLRPLVEAHDAAIFTLPDYAQEDLRVAIIAFVAPSIDPLSAKNVPLEQAAAAAVVSRFGLDPTRPLLLQVSRFDPWKVPLGVSDAYRAGKRQIPTVQLALVGSMASDDPEGWRIYEEVKSHVGDDRDIALLSNLDGVGSPEVNAFQLASQVVIQKSLREGFGLTVSEALWKGVPVVGGRVGGIPMQIGHDECGRLVSSVDEAAAACLELLRDGELRRRLGAAGHERVRRFFLSTRNLRDYLALFGALRTGDRSLVPTGAEYRA